jgi:hypothetical protein
MKVSGCRRKVRQLNRYGGHNFLSGSLMWQQNTSIRRVSFSQISIRSFDLCIGDSPTVLTGVPISLDWTFTESPPLSVDEFEGVRYHLRRSKQELKMSAQDRRRKLVFDFGIPEETINQRVVHRSVFPRNPDRRKVVPSRISSSYNVNNQEERQFDDLRYNDKSIVVSSRTEIPALLSKVPPRMCSIPKAA